MAIELRDRLPVGKVVVSGIMCGRGGCRVGSVEIDDHPATPRHDALMAPYRASGLSYRQIAALDPSLGLTPRDINHLILAKREPVDEQGWLAIEALFARAARKVA